MEMEIKNHFRVLLSREVPITLSVNRTKLCYFSRVLGPNSFSSCLCTVVCSVLRNDLISGFLWERMQRSLTTFG